jgi:hypothetical protein
MLMLSEMASKVKPNIFFLQGKSDSKLAPDELVRSEDNNALIHTKNAS